MGRKIPWKTGMLIFLQKLFYLPATSRGPLDGPICANRFAEWFARIISGFLNWTALLRMAFRGTKIRGWQRVGAWKGGFENTLIFESRVFSDIFKRFSGIFRAFFVEVVPWKMPENFLIQKSGHFQGFSGIFQVEKGIFKSPLLCPHPWPSSNKSCESLIWGDSCESLTGYENEVHYEGFSANQLARIAPIEDRSFALRIAGPSKFAPPCCSFMHSVFFFHSAVLCILQFTFTTGNGGPFT